jgi:hypothetical protein
VVPFSETDNKEGGAGLKGDRFSFEHVEFELPWDI